MIKLWQLIAISATSKGSIRIISIFFGWQIAGVPFGAGLFWKQQSLPRFAAGSA
tara:strand:- start:8770 stop:8931 length:162 start_codon:yes stop_codon:yes gene_type:complete